MKCVAILLLCHFNLLLVQAATGRNPYFHSPPPPNPASSGFTLCPSLPEASLSADQLLSKLQGDLGQADGQIEAALQEDKSPGGAVLSFVYGGEVLWSKGYGLKNMSGSYIFY